MYAQPTVQRWIQRLPSEHDSFKLKRSADSAGYICNYINLWLATGGIQKASRRIFRIRMAVLQCGCVFFTRVHLGTILIE